jgi:hypothetical protein
MDPPFHLSALLADHAAAVEGKLYVNGGGWSRIVPGLPFSIALSAKVPWDQTNINHPLRIELVDADGQLIEGFPVIEQAIAVPRPLGVKPGTPIDWCAAVQIVPPALDPGRYEFRIEVGGVALDASRLCFDVVPMPPGMQQAAA